MSYKIFDHAAPVATQPMLWPQVGAAGRIVESTPPAPFEAPPPVARGIPLETRPDANAELRMREAFERGKAEGQAKAGELAAAEVRPVLERLAKTLTFLVDLRARIRRDAEHDVVKLSLEVARRILRRELTVDPTSLQGVVKAALEKIQSREIARVRTHPDQLEIVRSCLGDPDTRRAELIADPSLEPWQVLFETAQGSVDASVEAQLAEIERGFTDRLK